MNWHCNPLMVYNSGITGLVVVVAVAGLRGLPFLARALAVAGRVEGAPAVVGRTLAAFLGLRILPFFPFVTFSAIVSQSTIQACARTTLHG